MSRSAIYTVNTDIAVLEGGIIPLGAIVRRYGPCLDLNGNGITVRGDGYYTVNSSITVEPTAAGPVTVQLLLDGVVVAGATASVTATAGAPVNLSIVGMVRDCCPDGALTLTVQLVEGAGNVVNIATTVFRL
jgi:hypothetical protein